MVADVDGELPEVLSMRVDLLPIGATACAIAVQAGCFEIAHEVCHNPTKLLILKGKKSQLFWQTLLKQKSFLLTFA